MSVLARVVSGASLAVVLAVVLAQVAPPSVEASQAGPRCRRVKLDGTIVVTPNPRPGFRGVVLASEGRFAIDLIFAEKGGDVLYQQNTVTLTRLKSHSYGGALECRNTLPAEAVAPRPFKVWARLGVGEVVAEDANQKVKSVSDQFDFMVKTLPAFPAFSYSTTCTGGQPGTTSDHGIAIVQLLHVFNRTQYSGSVALNRMGDTRRLPAVDVFGSMTASAEWEPLETLVPCGNFQYK